MVPDFSFHTTITDKYIIGSLSPFIATAISFLPELESWLKIIALMTGIIISILSFLSAEAEKRRNREQTNRKEK